MLSRNRRERVHVGWMSAEMDHDQCPRTRSDRGFHRGGRKIQRHRIDVGKNGASMAKQHRCCCRDEGERRNDDFIPALVFRLREEPPQERQFRSRRKLRELRGASSAKATSNSSTFLLYPPHDPLRRIFDERLFFCAFEHRPCWKWFLSDGSSTE